MTHWIKLFPKRKSKDENSMVHTTLLFVMHNETKPNQLIYFFWDEKIDQLVTKTYRGPL
jgi:hypothetical protein